jgi:hypothetical protein
MQGSKCLVDADYSPGVPVSDRHGGGRVEVWRDWLWRWEVVRRCGVSRLRGNSEPRQQTSAKVGQLQRISGTIGGFARRREAPEPRMALLEALNRDHFQRELAPLIHCELDPAAIEFYGLPAYKSYHLRKHGQLLKRCRKLLAKRKRRRFLQEEDYIRLGRFRETETYRFLEELWAAGLDYRQVTRYRDFVKRLESGNAIRLRSKRRRMESVADLDDYFQDYVQLLQSMQARGYIATTATDRITIMIDRDGGILKETKGRHRLAAAQIVGAPWVPVRISHVHTAWVAAQGCGATQEQRLELARRALEKSRQRLGARG